MSVIRRNDMNERIVLAVVISGSLVRSCPASITPMLKFGFSESLHTEVLAILSHRYHDIPSGQSKTSSSSSDNDKAISARRKCKGVFCDLDWHVGEVG